MEKYVNNLMNTTKVRPLSISSSNKAYILPRIRGQDLLVLTVRARRPRSWWTTVGVRRDATLCVALVQTYHTWWEDAPYWFSRSGVKCQGHVGQIIDTKLLRVSWSNLAHILPMIRGWCLLVSRSRVKGQVLVCVRILRFALPLF